MSDGGRSISTVAYRRIGSVRDPRRILEDNKLFRKQPDPLAGYLMRRDLSRTTERVFWMHWQAGARRGDFTSEIPVAAVASYCGCTRRQVFRAYNVLKSERLLRRQDPGRHPAYPHRQAILVTEVFLPDAAREEVLKAPDRVRRRQQPALTPQVEAPALAPVGSEGERAAAEIRARYGVRAVLAIGRKFSTAEHDRWHKALLESRAGRAYVFDADSGTHLDAVELTYLRHVLDDHLARAREWRPTSSSPADATPRRRSTRELDTFSRAHLRKQLSNHVPLQELDTRFHEIIWSVEQGQLARLPAVHALRVALKLIRDGTWSRPRGMSAV